MNKNEIEEKDAIYVLSKTKTGRVLIGFLVVMMPTLVWLGIETPDAADAARELRSIAQQRADAYKEAQSLIRQMYQHMQDAGIDDETIRINLITQHNVLALADATDRSVYLLWEAMEEVLTPAQREAVENRYYQILLNTP